MLLCLPLYPRKQASTRGHVVVTNPRNRQTTGARELPHSPRVDVQKSADGDHTDE
jgi:hypothetical protein